MALLGSLSSCYYSCSLPRDEDVEFPLENQQRENQTKLVELERLTSQTWAKKGKIYKPWGRSLSDLKAKDGKPKADLMEYPQENWLFGFRDRALERKYLDHTALEVFPAMLVAFLTIILLQFVVGVLWVVFVSTSPDSFSDANSAMAGSEGFKEGIGCVIMSMLPILLGLIGVVFIKTSDKVNQKSCLLLVTELSIILEVVIGRKRTTQHTNQLSKQMSK